MRSTIERQYKDKLFRMIFKEKDKLLSLYNAVNKSNYTDPEDLEIVTLENAIYINMKNDLAFLIDDSLNIYEHQSTVNPNMLLRNLIYAAKEYQKLEVDKTIYSSVQIKLPEPKFIVFYNGAKEQPEKQVLKLSDAYEKITGEPELELKVTVLNINGGYNTELLEACQTLKEYVLYVEKVRKYVKQLPLEEAVDLAIDECIKKNVLKDYLSKYRAEAKTMSILEYDEEREMELIKMMERKAAREEGLAEGRTEGRAKGLAEGREEGRLKMLIDMIYKKIQKEKTMETIADELEEDIKVIKPVYEAVKAMGHSFDCDEVYKQINK